MSRSDWTLPPGIWRESVLVDKDALTIQSTCAVVS